MVFVAGEAGVGKTRLAQEFMKIAKTRGGSILYARSASGSSLQPYSAWVECVRQFASEATVLSFIEICGDLSEPLFRLLPEVTAFAKRQSAASSTAKQLQQQSVFELSGASPLMYFDALAQFVFRLSNRRTLSIVLDDFQWCDQSSLDLLQYIASHGLADHPLLILCLYRDTHLKAANPSLMRVASGMLGGQARSAAIRLERLDRHTATRLMKDSSSALQMSDRLCQLLYRKTGGNPLFIKETLTLLAQKDILSGELSSRFVPSEISEIQVPNSVKDVIRQRLAPVDPEVREALQIAALVGESFDVGILRKAAPANRGENLLGILEAAAASGLLHEKPSADGKLAYAFGDEVIVEVLTEQFSKEALRRYHLRIAKIKEEDYGARRDERATELADHFRKGGSLEKDLEYSMKAGDAADRVNAHKEAGLHYERALECLEQRRDQNDELTRGLVLEKLGDNLWIEGNSVKAYGDWEESATTYEALGERERAGSLRCKMGWFHSIVLCEGDKAGEEFRQALEDLSKIPRGPKLAVLYHHIAEHYWFENKPELVRENCEKAIEVAREFHVLDVDVLASVILAFVTPIDEKEKIMNCLRKSEMISPDYVLSTSYDISRGYDSAIHHALTHTGIGLAKLTGDTKTAQKYLSQGLEIARKIGSRRQIIWTSTWLAHWGYIPTGEWEKARQLLAEALSWAPLEAFPVIKAAVYNHLGTISLLEGDLDKAEGYLKVAYDCRSRFGSYVFWDAWGPTDGLQLGRFYTVKGDYRSAERYLRQAYKMQKGDGSKLLWTAECFVDCLFLLVQLYVQEGDREQAASYLVQLQDFAGFAGTDSARAYASWGTGLLASLDADWREAIPAFEEAAEGWKRLGWPYQWGNTYRSLALARLERGEVEIASGLLDEALGIFNRIGAKRDVEETLVAKAALKDQGASQVFKLTRDGSERSKRIFEYLVEAFIGDYFNRKLSPDSSGWRSLVKVAKETKISRSRFYRATEKNNQGLQELLRLGLVEERDFPHQRGRGGTATRTRIAYENEDVKKYIARRSKATSRTPVQTIQ